MSKRLASDRPDESYYEFVHIVANASGDNVVSLFVAPFDLSLQEVVLLPDVAMTGDDGQGMALVIFDGGTAGAGTGSMASIDFSSTDTVVSLNDKESFTMSSTAADLLLDAGDILLISKVEEGTDAFVLPDSQIYLRYKAV